MGTFDANWKKTRAPYMPTDFDMRFHNMAHPDLIYPGVLEGGEPITITNMHPDGTFKFDLPQVKLITRIQVSKRVEEPAFKLETVILEPNQRRLSMVWRAAMTCDKEMLKISEITIGMSR